MLYAVAAAVIGGTSLFGGRGKMMHALLGGLVIARSTTAWGCSACRRAQFMITALVLLAAVIVDRITRAGSAV